MIILILWASISIDLPTRKILENQNNHNKFQEVNEFSLYKDKYCTVYILLLKPNINTRIWVYFPIVLRVYRINFSVILRENNIYFPLFEGLYKDYD